MLRRSRQARKGGGRGVPRARGCEGQAEGISQEADGASALRLTVDTQLCGVPGWEGARLLSGRISMEAFLGNRLKNSQKKGI